jgi:predicted nucleotidyltransferase
LGGGFCGRLGCANGFFEEFFIFKEIVMQYTDGLDEQTKQKIIKLLQVLFPDATIYLYGSRARGTNRDNSDIDLAIDAGKKIDTLQIGEAKSILEGLFIPYTIDLVDMRSVSEKFRSVIEKERVIWHQSKLD